MKKNFLRCFLVVLSLWVYAGLSAEAQNRTYTGSVTDTEGASIPGASVTVKDQAKGTVTDIDGKFSLEVAPDVKVLVFSFLGMKAQEVELGETTVLNIVLQADLVGLDEVVVVGYGSQKKVNLTGSVSTVKIDSKLTSRSLATLSSGLSGLMPGLSVNQNTAMAGKTDGTTLLIRGMGSVNDSKPLIVVDGMPDVDINTVNMNDVESISVLKDATSSSVYGSRAANGVILITTKTGKGQDKTKINYSTSYGVLQPIKTAEFMADYPRALTLSQRMQSVGIAPAQFNYQNGTIDQWMALGMIDPLRYPNTNWWDVVLRDGSITTHDVSATGGNDKSNFFVSLGMMDNKGLQINNDYTRYNARFNYDNKLNYNMSVGVRFFGTWTNALASASDGFIALDQAAGTGLNMQFSPAGITPYDPITGYYGGAMALGESSQANNPLTASTLGLNHTDRQEANSNIYWDWTPIKGLVAKIDYSLNYHNQFKWSAATPAKAYNFQTNAFSGREYQGENSPVSNETKTGHKTQLNGRLSYNTKIGENQEITALFVYSEEYWFNRSQSGSRNDRYHASLHELDAALTNVVTANGWSNEQGMKSYIGRLNYSLFERYLFEASVRRDASSKFIGDYQYGFFPSASLGWRFTEEAFMKSLTGSWLSNGKFRASYGGLGNNSGVTEYEQKEALTTYNYMVNSISDRGFVNKKMINPDLSWEVTNVLDLGLDLGFMNNHLTVEFDYYDRLTTGMLRPSDMSIFLTGAYDAPRKNIGDLRNRGVEGNITWQGTISELNYTVNLNGSYNATVLEKWNEPLNAASNRDGNPIFINMPYGFTYTFLDNGIAQTWQDVYNNTPQGLAPGDIMRKDVNGDGRISDDDKVAYTNSQRATPTTNYALNTSFSWKMIDLAILFQGAAGRTEYWNNVYNTLNPDADRFSYSWDHWNKTWSVENRGGEWPRLGGSASHNNTEYWLDDLSYLRLKNIQLGVKLPSNLLKKIHFDNLRIYGSADNLLTFTSFRGIDPEAKSAEDVYPMTKSFTIGLNVSF
jgi:TonB-linked SusC/RagA family outer membrane protein